MVLCKYNFVLWKILTQVVFIFDAFELIYIAKTLILRVDGS